MKDLKYAALMVGLLISSTAWHLEISGLHLPAAIGLSLVSIGVGMVIGQVLLLIP